MENLTDEQKKEIKMGLPRIHYLEAKYLKHFGKINDVKVSLAIVLGRPVLHIMDFEFWTFAAALHFLQNVAPRVVEA